MEELNRGDSKSQMKSASGNKMWWFIGGALVIAGGVTAVVLFMRKKKKDEDQLLDALPDNSKLITIAATERPENLQLLRYREELVEGAEAGAAVQIAIDFNGGRLGGGVEFHFSKSEKNGTIQIWQARALPGGSEKLFLQIQENGEIAVSRDDSEPDTEFFPESRGLGWILKNKATSLYIAADKETSKAIAVSNKEDASILTIKAQ
jgi:hypothetical protein